MIDLLRVFPLWQHLFFMITKAYMYMYTENYHYTWCWFLCHECTSYYWGHIQVVRGGAHSHSILPQKYCSFVFSLRSLKVSSPCACSLLITSEHSNNRVWPEMEIWCSQTLGKTLLHSYWQWFILFRVMYMNIINLWFWIYCKKKTKQKAKQWSRKKKKKKPEGVAAAYSIQGIVFHLIKICWQASKDNKQSSVLHFLNELKYVVDPAD